jgi:hypothetical protein
VTPEFFLIDCREDFPKYPSGNVDIPVMSRPDCSVCGRSRNSFEGNGTLRLRGGKQWSDLVRTWGTHGPHFVISQRVKDSLDSIECRGVRWFTTAAQIDAGPRGAPPNYYWLAVDGRIETDLVRSPPMPREERCPSCDAVLECPKPPQKFEPLAATWDGSDFFKIANYRSHYVGVSRRVLELARFQRWTNCRFTPFDVYRRHAIYWDGIDYLGKTWPPDAWYPVPKSARRSREEWLQWLGGNIFKAAHDPLLDFCPAVIADLRKLIQGGTELQRWNAQWTLWYAHHDGYLLEPEEIVAAESSIQRPAPIAALRDRLLHGDESERQVAAHGLFEWRKLGDVMLSPAEKAAVRHELPAAAADTLDERSLDRPKR